jgi:dimethylhistidine N-methyltransferase
VHSAIRYDFRDLRPDTGSFLADVLSGLARTPKALPPKYFYDARGCELFEAICDLDEYYPTRTEMAIMRRDAPEMAACLGPGSVLIEFGSGTSRKTRVLIDALQPPAYVPIDIAGETVQASGRALAHEYPGMAVTAVCADYSRPLSLAGIDLPGTCRRAVYFPGSTIGNFTPSEARNFMREVAGLAGGGGALLVGVDLKKAPALLNAAYDDARGITAAFNLNVIARINRELGADFDVDGFRHRAFYDEAMGRIEMHLVSVREQFVAVGGRRFRFAAGETIHTENSCKYSVQEFQALAREAGFEPVRVWTDPAMLFSVHYLVVTR